MRTLLPVTSMVPPPLPAVGPRAMPRLPLSAKEAVAWSVPPLRTSWPGVALPGAVPRLVSALTLSVPPLRVVLPL